MTTPQENPTEHTRDQKIQRALLRAYVNKNYDKYQSMWDMAETRSSKQTWNWAAFVFSLGWLAYRKMYLLSAIWIALILLEVVASMVVGYAERYSNIFTMALAVDTGQVGNALYALHANKQVDQVKAALPSSHWVSTLRVKGGVNWWAGIGAFVICILLLFFVALVAGTV